MRLFAKSLRALRSGISSRAARAPSMRRARCDYRVALNGTRVARVQLTCNAFATPVRTLRFSLLLHVGNETTFFRI